MMSLTRGESPSRWTRLFLAPALAGLMLAAPAVLFAAAPAPLVGPEPRLQDDDEEGPALLSDYEINLIQVYEIDLEEEPRVRIERSVLQDFLDDPAYAGRNGMPRGREEIRDFLRADGWEQLELLFSMRARDYYGECVVQEEPERMREWKRINTRYLSQYFMRHFANRPLGPDVELAFQGRPIDEIPLIGRGRDETAIAYTNFYILTQMTVNGVPLIDRDRPDESILLQWGMPREDARSGAPDVDGWQPYFRGSDRDDPRLEALEDWIASLVRVNQTSRYGCEYLPPALRVEEDENE